MKGAKTVPYQSLKDSKVYSFLLPIGCGLGGTPGPAVWVLILHLYQPGGNTPRRASLWDTLPRGHMVYKR